MKELKTEMTFQRAPFLGVPFDATATFRIILLFRAISNGLLCQEQYLANHFSFTQLTYRYALGQALAVGVGRSEVMFWTSGHRYTRTSVLARVWDVSTPRSHPPSRDCQICFDGTEYRMYSIARFGRELNSNLCCRQAK